MKHSRFCFFFFLVIYDEFYLNCEYFSILAINYGPWSKEETQKLMRAVEEVFLKGMESEDAKSVSSSEKSRRNFLIEREKLLQKLPWNEIEAKVGTRYWRQCKQKW